MHVRHSGHRQEIINGTTAVGRHFASCGLENMNIQIIDSVKAEEHMALLNLEGYWQNILATFVENGNINIRDYWVNSPISKKPLEFVGGISRKSFTL